MRKFVYTILMLLVLAMGVGAGTLIGYHFNDAADAVTAKQLSKAKQSISKLQSTNQQASASISSLKDASSFASSVTAANSTQPTLSNTELAMAAYLDINGTTPAANLQRFGAGSTLNLKTQSDGTIAIDSGTAASTVIFQFNGDTINEGPDPTFTTPGSIQPTSVSVSAINKRYAAYQPQLDDFIDSASDDDASN